jgi:hypothetical protein
VHESVGRLPTGHAGGPTDARHPLLQPPSVPMPLASPQRKKLLRRAGTPIRL